MQQYNSLLEAVKDYLLRTPTGAVARALGLHEIDPRQLNMPTLRTGVMAAVEEALNPASKLKVCVRLGDGGIEALSIRVGDGPTVEYFKAEYYTDAGFFVDSNDNRFVFNVSALSATTPAFVTQ